MRVSIKTIPHKKQKYPTAGDYGVKGDRWNIRVSEMSDWRREVLVGIHELAELAWVRHMGISIDLVTEFDLKFEKERAEGKHSPEDEPGDDPRCPYKAGHNTATIIEELLAGVLDVNWEEHSKEIVNL